MLDTDKYTDEQKIIKEFVNQLAKDFDSLYFLDNMKNEEPLTKFWEVIGECGYIGILAQEEYGGTNFKAEDLVVFFENMARKGMLSHQLMNQVLCCDYLTKFGSEDQKKKYIPGIIAGKICAYAGMEQNEGTSLYDINMSANKEGNLYILNGNKNYVVGAGESDNLIISARTSSLNSDNIKEGISLFIVDSKSKGIEMIPKEINVRVTGKKELMMITGDTFFEVNFNNVEIPEENLIGRENSGGSHMNDTTSLMMIMMAAMSIGWGEKLLEMAVEYANNRVIFEEPIGSYQAIQHPMVRAKTDVELAKLITEKAVRVYDNHEDTEDVAVFTNIAKYTATEAAYSACDITMQAHGGSGFDRDSGIITLWPLILLARIIPLNNDVILEQFSEASLDLPVSA